MWVDHMVIIISYVLVSTNHMPWAQWSITTMDFCLVSVVELFVGPPWQTNSHSQVVEYTCSSVTLCYSLLPCLEF